MRGGGGASRYLAYCNVCNICSLIEYSYSSVQLQKVSGHVVQPLEEMADVAETYNKPKHVRIEPF